MSQNRDPFSFPKYENDHNFTGIKQCQKVLYKKPTHMAQNDEPWSSLNSRATESSMKRSALYQDPEVQNDSLDFHLNAVYDNHLDLFLNKNEILFQKETLMSNHRENDASKCGTYKKEIKVWVNPQKTSIYSITGVIESHHNASTNRGYSRKHDGGFYST
ncbi:protein CFAP276-like isoform X1 [Trichomycterus rosablanca]|uniref:protein CFAP276-like isoform X1 n=1 Tax=Trichomycterus rosablanca TaxID=2290929 RepID=UPI002F35D4BB